MKQEESVKALDDYREKKAEIDPRLVRQQKLVQLGQSISGLESDKSIFFHMVNESRDLIGFRQAFFFRRRSEASVMRLESSSSLSQFDKDAPAVCWLEDMVTRLAQRQVPAAANDEPLEEKRRARHQGWYEQYHFMLPAHTSEKYDEVEQYPFKHFCWTPLLDDGRVVGGLLVSSDYAWGETDRDTAKLLCQLYLKQWQVVKGKGTLLSKIGVGRKGRWIAAGLAVLALGFPLPLTILAPVEVVAQDPHIVSAPFNGVVNKILVAPNTLVKQGDPLLQMDDLELANELQIAERGVAVSRSHLARVSQTAIGDQEAKSSLLLAQAELNLAQAERDLARDRLERTLIRAARDGVVVYGAERDWLGRPVQTGEAIVQLADPARIEYKIKLPVKDSILLSEGSEAKLYLDSAPLSPRDSTIQSASYLTSLDEQGQSVYELFAAESELEAPPRIGVRGTAQIYGPTVPLIYTILRRPITAFRQWTGI